MAGGAAVVCLLASLAPPAIRPAGAATLASSVSVPQASRISGVDLQTFNDTTISPNFGQIAGDGANMVNITVWWEVPSSSSNTIVPGNMTMSDVSLIQLAQSAEADGLQVSITPDFVVGSNGWRGEYDPSDPSTFFSNYTQMLDHYAGIAQQLHMPMMWVGSEMVDSEQYTAQWESVIASVRQQFTGRLLYDVNWSTTANVQFYGALDAMSISAYYPLSNQADPTEAQLLAAWTGANPDNGNWVAAVSALEKTWQKPIYFGEAGYSYSTYAAEAPYTESYDASDPQLQYRCYQALDDTFRGDAWWGGVLWWAWDGGVYNMDGEPAEALIGTKNVVYPTPGAAPSASTSSAASGASTGRVSTGTSPTSGRPSGTSVAAGGAELSPSSGSGAVPAGQAQGSGRPSTSTSPGSTSTASAPGKAGAGAGPQADSMPMRLQATTLPGGRPTGFRAALVAAGIVLLLVLVALVYVARTRTRLGLLRRRPDPRR